MIGPHATDLISELTLAIQNGITAEQISHTIHAHPTTAEAVHEAVLATNGKALHFIEG
jgi:dihydrolipoamide dehydrogenase